MYFWRTYDQQEIDLIEESGTKLEAWEFKWTKQKVRTPKAWVNSYPASNFNIITKDNYPDWVI